MITRRRFFAGCALCAAAGFAAGEAGAETAPATTDGITRRMLSRMDGPVPGYVTISAEVEIAPGAVVGRHTHPGIESGFVLDGSLELAVEGQPPRALAAGDAYQIAAGVPHGGGSPAAGRVRLAVTYVVERDKPLASPA